MVRWLQLFFLLFVYAGCGHKVVGGSKFETPISSEKYSSAQLQAVEVELLRLINNHRKSKGSIELKADQFIQNLANSHSQAMASKQVAFGHGGFSERSRLISNRFGPRASAENVAFAHSAQMIFKGWLNSEGHRVNMEGPYNACGISVRGSYATLILTKL